MLYRYLTQIFAIFLAILLSACQPLERPFQPAKQSVWNAPPGPRASLYVASIENGPTDLDDQVAKSLQKLGIAAFTGSPVEHRYTLRGKIEVTQTESRLKWEVFDPFGKPTELVADVKIGDLIEGPIFGDFDYSAPVLASARKVDVLLGGVGVDLNKKEQIFLYVPIVKGAPGDGAESLSAALQEALIKNGIDVVPDQWTANYIVRGFVDLSVPKNGKQAITLTWRMERRNGEHLGNIQQRNRIKENSLNGQWGKTAHAVARAGAGSVITILHKVEPKFFKQKNQ